VASARKSDVDLASRVARLTAGQRECLYLVDDHATSKEIARQLGISRHTVDARLRGAIQTLGVSSRREAAVIYRAAMQAEGYQPFAYQSPRIVTAALADEFSGHDEASNQRESGGSDGHSPPQHLFVSPGMPSVPAAAVPASSGPASMPALPATAASASLFAAGEGREEIGSVVADSAVWTALPSGELAVRRPLLRLWGGANDLSPAQRVGGILVVTILAMLAFGMFLTGIEALTLLRS
jgi:DNA-binding CsgD family transcriptional regulator